MDNVTLDPIALLSEAFEAIKQENQTLQESVSEVRAMMAFEDRGWVTIGALNSGIQEGLDLEDLQDIIEKVSPLVIGGSLPKRAVDLHSGYVWGRGCFIEGTEKAKAGAPTNLRKMYLKNQDSLFSDSAREELQKARFITGNVLAAVNTKTHEVDRIPFNQIDNIRVDPNFPEKVLAYRRTWDTQDGTTDSTRSRWYYTKRVPAAKRQKSIADASGGNSRTPVEPDITIVDLRVNRQIGHVLGVPDALAGLLWSETYGRVLKYGEKVQEGLAKIIFRITNKSKAGAQQAGVRMSGFGGHGGTATMGDGQELSAVSTAGRGYDYASARPVAAMAASAWNISNMDLLNDSAAAGSSYGSAQALVGGNRNAMLLMQREWADFYKDIFEVLGLGRPTIVFEPFEAPDKYREMQALTLGAPALHDSEYRMKVLDILDVVGDPDDIPETLKARAIDQANAGVQQGAPDQGTSNGTRSGGSGANDQASSTEALRHEMAMSDIADRMERAVALFAEVAAMSDKME